MITIGITTYNRFDTLKKMAESFYDSILKIPYNIRIYDDVSTEFSIEDLYDIFPNAVQITRNEINMKANKNIYLMYKDFLNSEDQYLFNADSDLIFSKNWLEEGLSYLKKTDGVLTLFNAQNLKVIENIDKHFCVKEKIGSAGTILTRENVEKIISNIKLSDLEEENVAFDFKWCKLLQDHGKKIYCLKNSLVQHIGVNGQNSTSNQIDYGIRFSVDTVVNGQIINDVVEEWTINKNKGYYFLFPFEKIEPNTKIIIYGAGNVGQDYVRQIRKTNYCRIVGIVDKNYKNFDENLRKVDNPNIINSLEFDYIVIAVNCKKDANEIRTEILNIHNDFDNKIIYVENRRLAP